MRLNKLVSDGGRCSRREADRLIVERRVTVNGRFVDLGAQVEADDEIRLDNEILRTSLQRRAKSKIYIAFNKPVGVTCTTDQRVEGNIIDFIDHAERIFPIGRLDKDSEGLILLTNDGDIVNEILRAENRHEKEYLVAVDKPITDAFLTGMAHGVRIHRTKTLPCRIMRTGKYTFRIILVQGLNRQIRLMCAAFDYAVRGLQRQRIKNIRLDRLKLGGWRNLSPAELDGLLPTRQLEQP
ncbi:MAG: pseudouridine synthase [Gammaproteobacteria bacterium]|nr:pseudouridine synthase [Gammaproteobacteria bacterium]